MLFDNNIKKIIQNNKNFYAPIINGALEFETLDYFRKKGFLYFSLSELDKQIFYKDNLYSFSCNSDKIELNSSQAMKITALSSIYDRVFSINHCFRNEKHHDNVHLSEFKILELEFLSNDEDEIFRVIDDYLIHIIFWYNGFIKTNKLTELFEQVSINFPIERKEYREIQSEYYKKKENLAFDDCYFCDMNISYELKEPLYITHYPSTGSWRAKKKDSENAYLYNLVLPYGYGELVEFSIRETQYDIYKQKFDALGYTQHYEWYLEALKHNSNTRAGMGMGIERLGAWLMGLKQIGDQLVFPIYPCHET